MILLRQMLCGWSIVVAIFPAMSTAREGIIERPLIRGGTNDSKNSTTITIPHRHLTDPSSCNDNNACTADSYDAIQGVCVHQVIGCDDGDPSTFDTCDPTSGCLHTNYQDIQFLSGINQLTYFYEEPTTLGENDIVNVLTWIQSQVSASAMCSLPNTFDPNNQVGTISPCPTGTTVQTVQQGCIQQCDNGYSLTESNNQYYCTQNCLSGWQADAYPGDNNCFFCGVQSYYQAFPSSSRCTQNTGLSCELCGFGYFPVCPSLGSIGVSLVRDPSNCYLCVPETVDCGSIGYATGSSTPCSSGFVCSSYSGIQCPRIQYSPNIIPFACNSGYELINGLCYPICNSGNVGTNCVPTCAEGCSTYGTCNACSSSAFCVHDPLQCTFGNLAYPASAVSDWLQIFVGLSCPGSSICMPNIIGSAMNLLQSQLAVTSTMLPAEGTVFQYNSAGGNDGATTSWTKVANVVSLTYYHIAAYQYVASQNFYAMTSYMIDSTLNQKLNSNDAAYIKQLWAILEYNLIASTLGWTQAPISFSIGPYSTPECGQVFPFPTLPTQFPSSSPSRSPSNSPSRSPSNSPSRSPSNSPSRAPTNSPSRAPTNSPSRAPTTSPSRSPSYLPSRSPSNLPSRSPTNSPSRAPTNLPSMAPSQPQVCHLPQHADSACKTDVKVIETIGQSGFNGRPITIIDQTLSTVTFAIHQQWNSTGPVYVQYFDPVSRQYICVNVCNKDNTFQLVAHCMKRVPISIVEVWVETGEYNDNAVISSCCFAAAGGTSAESKTTKHYMEGSYELRCESLCEG